MARPGKRPSDAVESNKIYFSISKLSEEFNVTPRTIRHYEDEGLLEPARRGQTRLFTEADRKRLAMILTGTRVGISLAKLRELFDLYDNARGSKKRGRELLVLLGQPRQLLNRQRADLDVMMEELEQMEKACRAVAEPSAEPRRDHAQQDLFG